MIGALVTISGNLTANPELRYTQNGRAVAGFTVACTPRRLNRETNTWEDGDTLFLRCSAWRDLGENVAASLSKGDAVLVQGELVPRSYEKDGATVNVVELRAEVVSIDLRRQTASGVMRIRKATAADEAAEAWAVPADAPATRRQAAAA